MTSNKQLPALPPRHPGILDVYRAENGQRRGTPVAPLHQLMAASRSSPVEKSSDSAARTRESCSRLVCRVSGEYWLETWERTPLHGIYTVDEVIPPSLCRCIIREAASQDFATNRHKHFPTVDVPFKNLHRSWKKFEPILSLSIYPLLKSLYQLSAPRFNVVDLFVVRYKTGQQVELGVHRDGSIISFNILLNSSVDFCGGGTRFPGLKNLNIRGSRGSALIHCGKIKHAGVRITKGERMLLVGFINVVDDETILPTLSRCPLRSYSRDDDYLRGLWIGNKPIAARRRLGSKKSKKIITRDFSTREQGCQRHQNNKSGSGILTCLSRFGCASATSSFN